MRYLIPCRIFLGKLYDADMDGTAQDYFEYCGIINCIKLADFKGYGELNKKY